MHDMKKAAPVSGLLHFLLRFKLVGEAGLEPAKA